MRIAGSGSKPTAFPARFTVPGNIAATILAASAHGIEQSTAWSTAHPGVGSSTFDKDAAATIGPPPSGAAADHDLAIIRDVVKHRTDELTTSAVWWARFGGLQAWELLIDDIRTTQGPQQAKRAAELLRATDDRLNELTDAAKRQYGRKRPYEVDHSIEVVVPRPDGNPSYPSGHSAAGWAAATVLAAFLPERAEEIRNLAVQASFSRMYGGVHFLSDVAEGARVASMVAADVLRRAGLSVSGSETLAAA